MKNVVTCKKKRNQPIIAIYEEKEKKTWANISFVSEPNKKKKCVKSAITTERKISQIKENKKLSYQSCSNPILFN